MRHLIAITFASLSAKAQATGVPLFSEFAVKDDVVTWFGTMSRSAPVFS